VRQSFVLVAAIVFSIAAHGQFETRTIVPTLRSPESIAVGDFNHDGKPDLAVAAFFQGNQVAVLLGNGDGTFLPPVNYLAGTGPYSVVAADFNDDGNLDLAVADYAISGTVSILLGNGDGTFQSAKAFSTPQTATFVAVGDFNGDHKLDLVIIDYPMVSVMLGNGDGTFQSPISFMPQQGLTALGVGDFNHDGKLDLAVGKQDGGLSQVQVFLGNGDGTFRAGANYPVGPAPSSVAVADFRHNGKLDLAVACSFGMAVAVLLGNGDGTSQQAVTYSSSSAYWVTAADLNGDGKLDLAVSNFNIGGAPPSSVASVLLGNGDGTFQSAVTYPTGGEGTYVAVADFNGDGKPDLVVTDPFNNDVVVLLNTGVVSLSPTTPLTYAPQLLGTKSAAQTVTFTNTGTSALSISSISVQGEFKSSNTCGQSVEPGANCSINVRSEPTTEGSLTGTVTIHDTASSKPQVIELSGAGTVVKLEPSSMTFAAQTVGTKSAPQEVRLTNTGKTALTITAVYLLGTEWQDFSETNNCGGSVAPGASCTFGIRFHPRQKGPLSSSLAVYDSGGGSPQTVPLTGTGD
jgi:hypothetical protein